MVRPRCGRVFVKVTMTSLGAQFGTILQIPGDDDREKHSWGGVVISYERWKSIYAHAWTSMNESCCRIPRFLGKHDLKSLIGALESLSIRDTCFRCFQPIHAYSSSPAFALKKHQRCCAIVSPLPFFSFKRNVPPNRSSWISLLLSSHVEKLRFLELDHFSHFWGFQYLLVIHLIIPFWELTPHIPLKVTFWRWWFSHVPFFLVGYVSPNLFPLGGLGHTWMRREWCCGLGLILGPPPFPA